MNIKNLPTGVIDFETDPFKYQRTPKPFMSCFYNGAGKGKIFHHDPIDGLLKYLESIEPHLIYAHNGGKFDFFFLLSKLSNPIKIISGRIVECKLGKHVLRDSYSAIPVSLATYKKDEIDYAIFEEEERDKFENHVKIRDYLRNDCIYLYDLVTAFRKEFDSKMTVGSAAIHKLSSFMEIPKSNEWHDAAYRPYYSGGRVQCFKTGKIEGPLKVYDVNSMYPHVMRDFNHPVGFDYMVSAKSSALEKALASDAPFFVDFTGYSAGALPVKNSKSKTIGYPHASGRFMTTGHELRAGLDLALITIDKLHLLRVCADSMKFTEFVDTYSARKIAAKHRKDKIDELFSKFVLNSCYGKFGQNPAHYKNYSIYRRGDSPLSKSWTCFDVAVAASITGAARSLLLRAIHESKAVAYADTDSIICESTCCELDDSRLGAWKLECECDTALIMGKKLYGLYKDGVLVKSATKGFRLKNDNEMLELFETGVYNSTNDAPNFKLDGSVRFVKRSIKPTVCI
jgi:DNA polymerase elongation subunit (family B)